MMTTKAVSTRPQNADMDLVFERIDRELKRQERNWAWLARELDISRAADAKWKEEGVPKGRYDEIAVALRQTAKNRWVADCSGRAALVLPDGSLKLPAWTRVDLALRYATRLQGHATTWTLGIDNLLDRRYWKESPYQYGHVFLYPGSARSLRVNFSADF